MNGGAGNRRAPGTGESEAMSRAGGAATRVAPRPSVEDVAGWIRHDLARLERLEALRERDGSGRPGRAGRGAPSGSGAQLPDLPELRWQPELDLTGADVVDARTLMGLHDAEFVAAAFRAVLRRDPDGGGFRHFLDELRHARLGKHEVLARLRWSPEGRRKGVRVRGVLLPAAAAWIGRLPVVGPIVRWISGLVLLPAHRREAERFQAFALAQHEQAVDHVNELARRLRLHVLHLHEELERLHVRLHDDEEAARMATALRGLRSALQSELTAVREAREVTAREREERLRRSGEHEAAVERRLAEIEGRLAATEGEAAGAREAIGAGTARMLDALEDERRSRERQAVDAAELAGRLSRVEHALRQETERSDRSLSRLASQLDDQRAARLRLEAALERSSSPARPVEQAPAPARPVEQAPAPAHTPASAPAALEALYLGIEEAFRGSRAEVRERAGPHVQRLAALGAQPVLDLGCGRGELLELLAEAGLEAAGVDANPRMVEACRARGLDVALGDALDALRRRPVGTLGAVTALHLVEHLPFPSLVALVDEAARVLRPGGVLLLETPNPGNVFVSTLTFHLDPTHHRPLPPQLLALVVGARGLDDVEVVELHPPESPPVREDSEVARRFNAAFHAPLDYALIARKPAP